MFSLILIIIGLLLDFSSSLRIEQIKSPYLIENIGFLAPIKNKLLIIELVIDGSGLSRDFVDTINTIILEKCDKHQTKYSEEAFTCNLYKGTLKEIKMQKYNKLYDDIFVTLLESIDDSDVSEKRRRRRRFSWKNDVGYIFGDWIYSPLLGLMCK